MNDPEIIAVRCTESFSADPVPDIPTMDRVPQAYICYNWRGEPAPPELQTSVMTLWNDTSLCFRFDCRYTELDMDDPAAAGFDADYERYGLWERDVCEVFLCPAPAVDPRIYLEFEAAPNGQWCDLKIDWTRKLRDWEWRSGLRIGHMINEEERIFRIVMIIPFTAVGLIPQSGDIWHANLYRIGRLRGVRQYLTFNPTLTGRPNFHVPERFAGLRFV